MKIIIKILFLALVVGGVYGFVFYQTPQQRVFKEVLSRAQAGQAESFYQAGVLYEQGQGTVADAQQAAQWYRKAAADGNLQAARQLAHLYIAGKLPAQDAQEGFVYLQWAARGGDGPAQKELARLHHQGAGGAAKNEAASLFWCMYAALQQNEECINQVKQAQVKTPNLYEQAFKAFTASIQAQVGSGEAALELGKMYEEGILAPDMEEAARWYQAAAEQKIPQAQARLGLLYAQGRGVEKDEEKARALLAPAAQAGDPQAQLYWGKQAYTQSEQDGGPDYTEAFKWFISSAEQGNLEAQYLTGVMYMQGQGTEKSVSKAMRFFSRAAEGGYADAQYVVGQSYYKGLGIRPNRSEAEKWLGKAADNGHQAAKELLQELTAS